MAELKKNTIHPLTIQGYTAEGMGVGRLDGRVVFVPDTIRGEIWEVQLLKVNKNVAWGKGVRLLEASSERIQSDCPHAVKCGGCQYRHMTYAEELFAKKCRVSDALHRLGGAEIDLPDTLGAEDPLRYRNKVQFPVAPGKQEALIGFYRPRSHDVIDVEDCLLQPLSASAARKAVKEWMKQCSISAYDESTGKGLLRHLYLRSNQRGEVLCCLIINGKKLPHGRILIDLLQNALPGLVGLVVNSNMKDTNVILGDSYYTIWGQDYLEETLCGLTFRLSVPSFFQVNRAQTERLYALAIDFADLKGSETVLDLYCGIGTISLDMAQRAGKVIGAEIVPEAIEDAKENAARNGVENAEFFCGDAGEIAFKLSQSGIRPDVVCVDPPRKGLQVDVPGIIAGMNPERIVYVSCDPATLGRDVKRFAELGYHLIKAQPVDLFPRTAHVETVVLLSKGEIDSKKVRVEFSLEDMDMSDFQDKATYTQIKDYVLEHSGLKVSNLYISQIKRKCGLEVGKNYNLPKAEDSRQPQCPSEKENAIREAMKYFGMI